MTKAEMVKRIEELQNWEEIADQAKAEAEAIKKELQAEMLERETEELVVDKYIIRWTSVLTNKFNTTEFKKAYNELYKVFLKQTQSRRFSIAC